MKGLIIASAFITVVSGCLSAYLHLTRKKRQIRERMQKYTAAGNNCQEEDGKEKESGPGLKAILSKSGQVLARRGMAAELGGQLIKAGIPLKGEEYLIIWVVAALVPGTLLYLTADRILPALGLYFLGIGVPPFLVCSTLRQRMKKFNQQLSESLSMMSNSLRAGFSFIQAMETVSREMPEPLAGEFARTFRDISLGATTEEALQKMVRRVDSDDLDLLITAVLIQRQVGGNLAEILDNISLTIRERIRIKGEIRTLTAQGRISGLIIGLIPVFLAIFMLLFNPEYIGPLFKTPPGILLVVAALLGESTGMLIIRKIINIDY